MLHTGLGLPKELVAVKNIPARWTRPLGGRPVGVMAINTSRYPSWIPADDWRCHASQTPFCLMVAGPPLALKNRGCESSCRRQRRNTNTNLYSSSSPAAVARFSSTSTLCLVLVDEMLRRLDITSGAAAHCNEVRWMAEYVYLRILVCWHT